jgi:hypothetical protein
MFGSNHAADSAGCSRHLWHSSKNVRAARLAWLSTLVTAAAMVYPVTVATTARAAEPGPPPGWSTIFSDDFNGAAGSPPSSSNWMFDTGPGSSVGTGEIETMTDSTANTYLDGNGNLDITALSSGGSWTSGRIQTTAPEVGAPVGGKLEVTASIQQPNPSGGLGYWPAFWMLGPGQWPENGEIDIMEDVNALSEVAGTIHCGTYPGGVCNEGTGIGSGLRACPGCQTGFHTYSMILDRTNTSAESITFSLDGSAYFSVSESQVGTSTWQAAFDHNASGATSCSNAVFGDPNNGVTKACYVETAPPGTNVWAQRAGENGTCSYSGVMTVAYGANGSYNYATLGGGTACNNTVFGDPAFGTAKTCYVQ